MRVLLIDNYDSFTWNLWQQIRSLGAECDVVMNDRITILEIEANPPDRIVISPGPGRPENAGISCDVIRTFASTVPIFGVCLGHQCIATVFGGAESVTHVPELMHGKISEIFHAKKGLFHGVPSPFSAARYHSLIVENLPEDCELLAWTTNSRSWDAASQVREGEIIMAMRHKKFPLFGVQFHPESFLTEHGEKIMRNFLFTS